MRYKKERLHLCIWALAVLFIVPFTINVIPDGNVEELHSISEAEHDTESTYESLSEEVVIPDGAYPVVDADLSGNIFKNSTKYSVDINSLKYKAVKIEKDSPAVLIIHTYGTQSYNEEGFITDNSTTKSENPSKNVLCVGEALCEALEKLGIKAIHDKTLYDKISYSGAYNLSTSAVKDYLNKYPTIKYVIDIQRDSVFSQNGNCIKSVTNTKKGKTAQISFIAGSDENGADFPNWQKNLSLSVALSKKLSEIEPKLSRGVFLMPSGYGQYTCEGFITVEIGTSGNTPHESKNAAAYLAEALHEIIS